MAFRLAENNFSKCFAVSVQFLRQTQERIRSFMSRSPQKWRACKKSEILRQFFVKRHNSNLSDGRSFSRSVGWSVSRSVGRSVSRSVSQSVSQLIRPVTTNLSQLFPRRYFTYILATSHKTCTHFHQYTLLLPTAPPASSTSTSESMHCAIK